MQFWFLRILKISILKERKFANEFKNIELRIGYVFNDNERGFLGQSVEDYYKEQNVTDVEYADIHNILFQDEFCGADYQKKVRKYKYNDLNFRCVLNAVYNKGKHKPIECYNSIFFSKS